MKTRALALIAVVLLLVARSAQGQSSAATSLGAETEEDQLAREVDDPTVILTQLKFQDLYTPGNFETSAQTNTAQFQAVVPVGAFSFLPFQQVGPAAAAVYRGVPHLMVGFLFQNPISFAYTNSSASPQSQMQFQPLVSYALGSGWYVKSADSTWTVNWRHGSSTTIPISLGFGKVWKFQGPELNTWVSGEWTAYRQYAGITPMYTVRFGLTLLFPRFEL